MPPIWSGSLAFGLVVIPVQMTSAVHSHKVAFRQIHTTDRGRVRNRKVCELDEQQLQPEEIGRAWEAPDGRLVPVSDDELDQMPLPTAKTIEVTGFIDLARIPGEQFGQPYFLNAASPAANKPYVLMREALKRSGKAAVGKWALRGTGEALGIIYPNGDALVAHRIHWPDELRSAAGIAPTAEVTDSEVREALALIDAIGDADLDQFHDTYAQAVHDLVEAKQHHAKPPAAPEEPARADAAVTDLMSALKAATDQARAGRGQGEDAQVHHMRDRRATKKKAPAKKTTKKTAAKKTTRKRAG